MSNAASELSENTRVRVRWAVTEMTVYEAELDLSQVFGDELDEALSEIGRNGQTLHDVASTLGDLSEHEESRNQRRTEYDERLIGSIELI